MLFEKFNRGSSGVVKEGTDLKAMEFKKLKEFKGEILNVEGYFFTNGDYGKQVCVIANGYKINLPLRAVEIFEEMDSDAETKQAIADGKMLICNIDEIKTKKGTITTTFEFKTK